LGESLVQSILELRNCPIRSNISRPRLRLAFSLKEPKRHAELDYRQDLRNLLMLYPSVARVFFVAVVQSAEFSLPGVPRSLCSPCSSHPFPLPSGPPNQNSSPKVALHANTNMFITRGISTEWRSGLISSLFACI
jgi:hypothetical protein